MDLNAIDNAAGTEDWTEEDWNYEEEWDYYDSDINAMIDWDWYDPYYDVNSLEYDDWTDEWTDWNDWTEDGWSMNALHYQTPTVSPQQLQPLQVTPTQLPQMAALPSTQPPTQAAPQQLAITQPAAAPTYAPGTYTGQIGAITTGTSTATPPGLIEIFDPEVHPPATTTRRRTGGVTFTNPANLASLFMALIAVMVMPTQTLQIYRETHLSDFNYIGNLTQDMASNYTAEDFTINAIVSGTSTFVTPEQELDMTLNSIMSDIIDWLMYDTGAATHV